MLAKCQPCSWATLGEFVVFLRLGERVGVDVLVRRCGADPGVPLIALEAAASPLWRSLSGREKLTRPSCIAATARRFVLLFHSGTDCNRKGRAPSQVHSPGWLYTSSFSASEFGRVARPKREKKALHGVFNRLR